MNQPTPPPLILSSEREIHQLLSVLPRLRLTKVEVLETKAGGELVQLKVETQPSESVPQLVPEPLPVGCVWCGGGCHDHVLLVTVSSGAGRQRSGGTVRGDKRMGEDFLS